MSTTNPFGAAVVLDSVDSGPGSVSVAYAPKLVRLGMCWVSAAILDVGAESSSVIVSELGHAAEILDANDLEVLVSHRAPSLVPATPNTASPDGLVRERWMLVVRKGHDPAIFDDFSAPAVGIRTAAWHHPGKSCAPRAECWLREPQEEPAEMGNMLLRRRFMSPLLTAVSAGDAARAHEITHELLRLLGGEITPSGDPAGQRSPTLCPEASFEEAMSSIALATDRGTGRIDLRPSSYAPYVDWLEMCARRQPDDLRWSMAHRLFGADPIYYIGRPLAPQVEAIVSSW